MRNTTTALFAAFALAVSACGPAQDEAESAEEFASTSETVSGSVTTDEGGLQSRLASDEDTSEDNEQAGDGETSNAPAQTTAETTPPSTSETAAGSLRSSLLASTLDSTNEVSAARFEGRYEIVGAAGSEMPGVFSMTFAGAYDLPNDSSQVTIDMSEIMQAAMDADEAADEMQGMEDMFAAFFEDPIEVITIGDKSWMKWGLLSMFTGAGDMWLEGAADDSGDLTSEFGFGGSGSPTELLELLGDTDADIETVGTEDIRGVSTTHYRVLVDAEDMAENMTAEERAEFDEAMGMTSTGQFPMELWIDDAGLLHRYRVEITDPAMLDDADLEQMVMVFDIWDHGADLGIEPPPADQIITEDELQFDLGDLDG